MPNRTRSVLVRLTALASFVLFAGWTGCGGTGQGQSHFFPTGNTVEGRWKHSATSLPNGKVLIAGGQEDENSSVSEQPLASAELYDPVTGTFVVTGSMMAARVGHAATLLGSGNVLIVGGGLLRAELYQ